MSLQVAAAISLRGCGVLPCGCPDSAWGPFFQVDVLGSGSRTIFEFTGKLGCVMSAHLSFLSVSYTPSECCPSPAPLLWRGTPAHVRPDFFCSWLSGGLLVLG